MEPLTPQQARASLARAGSLDAAVRRRGRWMGVYLAAFAAGFAVLTLVLGLVTDFALRMTLFAVAWPLFMLGMIGYAVRQPVALRGIGRAVAPYWIVTGGLYGLALFVGMPRFLGEPAYWVPAALLVGFPLALGAWRVPRPS